MTLFRKFTALLLAAALIFGSMGSGILSVSAASESGGFYVTDYHINPLYEDLIPDRIISLPLRSDASQVPEEEYLTRLKDVGIAIREQMKARNSSYEVYFVSTRVINTKEALRELMNELLVYAFEHTGVPTEGDYIRWQYATISYGIRGNHGENSNEIYYTLTLQTEYYTTITQEQTVTKNVHTLLDSLDVYSANDYEKLRAIYDYICSTVTYDHANLNNESYTLKYTAYAALMDHTAVCQGYALLLYRLALELGVDARLIAGDGGGPHGWNIAELDNLYYNLDSTWDAGASDYDYFLVCPDNFTDHIRYEEFDTPAFHSAYPMDDEDYVPPATSCSHSYTDSITKSPTCTDTGVRTYTCSLCGENYAEVIPSLGHNEVKDAGVAATCTETGLTEGKHCDRCNVVLTAQEVIPALGHAWDEGIVTKQPTEQETGIRTFTCTVCRETKEEAIPTLEHSHKYSSVVTAPTCTEGGYTTYTCACGDSYIDDEVAALGHTWDEGIVTKQPTEQETGIRTFTCTVCGETIEETIPMLDHQHSYISTVIDPTCTEDGYTTYICDCGDTYRTNTVPALGHNEIVDEAVAATCTEDGMTEGKHCDRCDTVLVQQETIAALGHDWDEGTVTKEPTKNENGIRTFTCMRCDATSTVEIPYEAPEKEIFRIAGKGRSETAIEAADALKAKLGVEKFNTIIIASGEQFADALAGSYLAIKKEAPILLSCKYSVEMNEQYIQNNLADDGIIYILGGTAELAVPAEVEESLKLLGYRTKRLAGADRYETSLLILEEAGVTDEEILICTGWGFGDSLAASATGLPIMMINAGKNGEKTELTDAQVKFLTAHASNKVSIIGGTAAIGEGMETTIDAIVTGELDRVYGDNRQATSIAVARKYFEAPTTAFIAYAWNFPDGLCGGPLAYAYGAPLLLTSKGYEELAKAYVSEEGILKGFILGGTAAVSDETMQIIFDMPYNSESTVR